ncbi:putative transporter YwbF [Diplonema papillatum]|nr:putative transporter YwbF [Diplonema papillatum]
MMEFPWRLNWKLVPAKAVYFLYFLGWCMLQPFLSDILRNRKHLTEAQVGNVLATYFVAVGLLSPLYTLWADVTGRGAQIFAGTCVACGLCAVGFVLAPGNYGVAFAFGYFFTQPAHLSMLDRFTLSSVQKQGGDWGKQRVWGSFSWGVFATVAGVLWDHDYDAVPCFVFCTCVFATAGVVLTHFQPSMSGNLFTVTPSASLFRSSAAQEILEVVAKRSTVIFLAVVATVPTGIVLFFTFVVLHLKDIGASSTLVGMSISVGVVSEIILLFVVDSLRRRLGGDLLILIAVLCMALRFFAYAVVSNPWWALAIEPLQGISFSCCWSAAVVHVSSITPPHATNGMMGVLNAVTWGFGPALGVFLGGYLYNVAETKGRILFCAVGTWCLLSALLWAAVKSPFLSGRPTATEPTTAESELALKDEADGSEALRSLGAASDSSEQEMRSEVVSPAPSVGEHKESVI